MANSRFQVGPSPDAGKKAPPLIVILSAGTALALIALAAPRLGSALLVLWGSIGQESLQDAKTASSVQTWAETMVTDAAVTDLRAKAAYGAVASTPPNSTSWTEALAEAMRASEEALAISPAQPETWLRLASLREMAGDPAAAASALRMSILSGPFIPELMEARLRLSARLLDHLSPDTLALAYRQVRLVQAHLPETFTRLSARQDLANLLFLASGPNQDQGAPDPGLAK